MHVSRTSHCIENYCTLATRKQVWRHGEKDWKKHADTNWVQKARKSSLVVSKVVRPTSSAKQAGKCSKMLQRARYIIRISKDLEKCATELAAVINGTPAITADCAYAETPGFMANG